VIIHLCDEYINPFDDDVVIFNYRNLKWVWR